MDLVQLQDVLNTFFDRAIVAISYKAAERVLNYLTSSASALAPGLSVSGVAALVVGALMLVSYTPLGKNECLQTTLCILGSKIGIQACTPMEPNAFRAGWVLPGVLGFFLCMYSCLCTAVRDILVLDSLRAQWDRLVPFVVIFTTTAILKAVQAGGEMRVLYVAALCHLLWSRPRCTVLDSSSYGPQFINSITSRGLGMILEDSTVMALASKAELEACLFFAGHIMVLYLFFSRESKQSEEWNVCIGVLIYRMCMLFVQTIALVCNRQVGVTFALLATMLTAYLYQRDGGGKQATNIFSNLLSIAWRLMLDEWVFSFFGGLEQVLVYMIIFLGVQTLRAVMTPVLAQSAAVMQPGAETCDTAKKDNANKMVVLIGGDSRSSSAGGGGSDEAASTVNHNIHMAHAQAVDSFHLP